MRWINAEPVGGSPRRQTKGQRRKHFAQYDKGNIDLLTYVKAIGVGWDSPHAKVLINLAPTTSMVDMIQAIGRVLRLSRNRNGKPIRAEVYDFADPELGDKQYTATKALKLESGQTLEHDETAEETLPRPQKIRRRPEVHVYDTVTHVVGYSTLVNEVEPLLPDAAEVEASIAAYTGSRVVSSAEACRILGLSPVTLRQILTAVGSNPHEELNLDELGAIVGLYPEIKPVPLPAKGFTSARQVADRANGYVRIFSLLPFARVNGFHLHRFTAQDGKVGFYFYDHEVDRLVELLNDRGR
jgi:hypothetical protein